MAKIARVQMPDGRIARFEVPDDYTPEQAMAEIQGQIAGMQQPQDIAPQQAAGDVPVMPDQMAQAPSVYEPKPQQERTIGERATGVVETLGALGTGATTGMLGQIAGTGQGLLESIQSGKFGTYEGANLVQQRAMEGAGRLTYKPTTEAGQEYTQAVGEAAAPLAAITPMAGEMAALASAASKAPMAAAQIKQIPKTIAARKLLNEAAPSISQLKETARGIYSSLDDAGVTVAQPELSTLAKNISKTMKKEGFNARNHPKVSAVLDEISSSTENPMSITEIDTMRKVARSAASSIDPSEARLGNIILEKIDDFMDAIPEQAVVGGKDQAVGAAFKQARGLWQRAKKSELIEEAVGKAKNQASGFENGLRRQFASLLNNKKKMRGFTADEKAALEKVVRGGGAENTLKFLGKFGFNEGQATSMLGSAVGMSGGAALGSAVAGTVGAGAGAIAVPMIGQMSRQLAQRLTRNNAAFADQVIRAGRNGKDIALAYIRNTPKAQRSAQELSELLMRPGVDVSVVGPISNPLIRDAAFIAELSKLSAASQANQTEDGANASIQGQQQNNR